MPAKIRSGFVSNSSSSSFILNFDEEISSKEQLHEKIFPEETVLDSGYSSSDSISSKDFCKELFVDYIQGTKPEKTKAIDEICQDIEIEGEWDFDYDTGYNKTLRIDRKNWFVQYNQWEYFAILKRELALKQKKYRNLIEQIKSPYVLSVDDCENLYYALTSNDRFLEKIILHVNNNH